jgi:type 1 glutamine amidotransferase
VVGLHHSVLAYPRLSAWRALTGIDPAWSRYDHGQDLRVRVADTAHPVTAGLSDFSLVDETYQMGEPDPGSDFLLTTEHPNSLKALAWAHSLGRAGLQPGTGPGQ